MLSDTIFVLSIPWTPKVPISYFCRIAKREKYKEKSISAVKNIATVTHDKRWVPTSRGVVWATQPVTETE